MGKIRVVFVTVFTYIFLTSEASKIKRELGDSNESLEDTQSIPSSNEDKTNNEGPRNVRINTNAQKDYIIFSLSHLHLNKDQYRYKTYLLACHSGSKFGNWENVRKESLYRRLKVDPYTNVTFQVREQTTGKIIATNSTVTPAKEPEANVASLECNQVKCEAIVEDECSKYNGYNITVQFTLKPSCDKLKNPLITHAAVISKKKGRVILKDLDLVPFTNYTVTAKLANNVGAATDPSLIKETSFISKSKSPGRVNSLNVIHSTPYSLHVVWSAPDDNPPKGKLSQYKLEWKIHGVSTNKNNEIVNKSVTSFNITGLQQNTTYVIEISAKNAQISIYGEAFSITATTKDEGASNPSTETEMTDAKTTQRSLHFSWDESRSDNCITDYYRVTFFDGDKRTVKNITDNEIRFDGLAPGKKYTLEVEGCPRTGKCEKLKTFEKWTKPEKPRVVEETELQTTTDTTITIQLPDLENPPGMHWILLRICSSGGECQTRKQDFSKEAEEMVRTERERNEKKRKETQANGRNRRSVDPGQNDDSLRIVAQIKVVEGEDPKETTVVGSKWNGGKGLESDTEYMVLIVTEKRAGPYSEYFSCNPRIMKTAKRLQPSAILGMIAGMCFAAIFLICIFTMLVVKFKKPRKKLPDNGYFNPVDKEDNSIINSVEQGGGVMIMPENDILSKDNKKKPEDDEKDAPQEDLYENLNHEVSKEDLEQYLPRAIYASETTMEFNSVPFFMTGKTTSGSRILENVPKNRYKNNISYDDTRVKLPLYLNIPHSDYINANFVQDPSGSAAFIATQGPKDHSADTIGAFWRMIWHSECRLILMVANLVEGGKIKVAQYWPEEEPMVKEGVKVTLTSVQILMDYAVRTFTLAVDGKERKVKQYHYMAWPDHGVPQTAYGLSYMLKAVIRDYAVEPQGPITVHCSAGIGRTGTIILTLFLLRQLRIYDAINTKKALHTLRNGRGRLVENEEQYIFVHKLLYDILFGMRTTFSCQSFVQEAAAIRSSKASDGTLILQKEYEKMKKLPKDLTFKRGNDPACAHLNRNQAILPADKRMMFVQMYATGNDSQYVNIIRVHGFDRKDAYMAGEHPQPHTLAKIWRLVYEQRVSVWLLLQELPHNDPSFPNVVRETSAVPGNMTLEISQPTHLENFTEYTATLTVKEKECWRNHKCTLLMLSGWSHTANLPSSPMPLLGAIEKAESLQLPQTPLLFTCSDGVTACGVMASLLLAVCRAKLTQEVDLYRSAVSVQYDRPQFITDLMQYQFLFTAMEAFLNENKHYGNFT